MTKTCLYYLVNLSVLMNLIDSFKNLFNFKYFFIGCDQKKVSQIKKEFYNNMFV